MNTIENLFANYKKLTHGIAVAIVAWATLYATNPTARDLTDKIFMGHPQIAAIVTGILGLIVTYMGSHSTQGQVALIASTPPAEVAAAITAVKAEAPVATPVPNLQNVVAAAAAKAPEVKK